MNALVGNAQHKIKGNFISNDNYQNILGLAIWPGTPSLDLMKGQLHHVISLCSFIYYT